MHHHQKHQLQLSSLVSGSNTFQPMFYNSEISFQIKRLKNIHIFYIYIYANIYILQFLESHYSSCPLHLEFSWKKLLNFCIQLTIFGVITQQTVIT